MRDRDDNAGIFAFGSVPDMQVFMHAQAMTTPWQLVLARGTKCRNGSQILACGVDPCLSLSA